MVDPATTMMFDYEVVLVYLRLVLPRAAKEDRWEYFTYASSALFHMGELAVIEDFAEFMEK